PTVTHTIVPSGTGGSGAVVTEGETWTFSVWVRRQSSLSDQVVMNLGFYDASNTFIGSNLVPSETVSIPNDEWVRVKMTRTIPTGQGIAYARFVVNHYVEMGEAFWATGCQIEKLPYMTSLAPA